MTFQPKSTVRVEITGPTQSLSTSITAAADARGTEARTLDALLTEAVTTLRRALNLDEEPADG